MFNARYLIVIHSFKLLVEIFVWPLKGPLNDLKEFMKRGGQAFVVEQIRVVLKMSRLTLKGAVKIRWLDFFVLL